MRERQYTVVKLLNLGMFGIRPSDEICPTTTPGFYMVKHNNQDCLCISYGQGALTEMHALLKTLIKCNKLEKEFRVMECQSTGTQTNRVEPYEKATQSLPLRRDADLPISVDKPIQIPHSTGERGRGLLFNGRAEGSQKVLDICDSNLPVVTEASSGPSAGQHQTQRHHDIVGRHSLPATSNGETRCVPHRSSAPGPFLQIKLEKLPENPSREVPNHCNGGGTLPPRQSCEQPPPAQCENNSSIAVQTPVAQSKPPCETQEHVGGPDRVLRAVRSRTPGGLVAEQGREELPASVGPQRENLLAKRTWKTWSDTAKEMRKRKRTNSDSDGEHVYRDTRVFDSDADTDEEILEENKVSQSQVLHFLNTAPDSELRLIPSVTAKKSEVIQTMRPFKGWVDLVTRFRREKSLGCSLLNGAQQVLEARYTVSCLMRKCERIAQRTENAIAAGSHNTTQQPSLLSTDLKLMPHQLVGLNWLNVMNRQRLSGILADEMGLGKTIQVIAFLAHLKETGQMEKGSPHLIVVPTSTLENWRIEFKRWCPSLKVKQYYGSLEERRRLRRAWLMKSLNDTEVVLTTYSMIGSCHEEKKMFGIIPFHYVVFDEAHMLKNINSQRYENLIKINALHKLLLIGTPPQNNLLELMSLLAFVMPDMFSGKSEILKFLFFKNSKQNIQEAPLFDQEQIQRANKIIRPFMLRRLKSDELKDLPAKTSAVMRCAMEEDQAAKYMELCEAAWNDTGREVNSMTIMMNLRKMANHPLTLRYHYQLDTLNTMAQLLSTEPTHKENDAARILEDLLWMSDHELHNLVKMYECLSGWELPDSVLIRSGKFLKLDDILPPLKATGHKVLIFSQFVFLLDIIEDYMRIRDHNFLRLDGSTPVCERQNMIDEFNQDDSIFVFLLSTKSGGIGINLPAADTIIIHDIDFNPYNDQQVEGRCHRLGQTRPVTITRFVSEGTIEEDILRIAEEKLDLEREYTSLKDDEVMATIDVAQLLRESLEVSKAKPKPAPVKLVPRSSRVSSVK